MINEFENEIFLNNVIRKALIDFHMGKVDENFMKSLAAQIGEIRERKGGRYKKIAEGKWERVGEAHKEKTDKEGNPIGDGTKHAPYKVEEFKEYPQISHTVDKAYTTESVYVKYSNKENGKSIVVRFSEHQNNGVKFGDQLDGYAASRDEILYRLGLRKKIFVPFKVFYVEHRAVKRSRLKEYEEAPLTLEELRKLPPGTDISKYTGKIAKDSNELILGDKVEIRDSNRGRYVYEKL